MQLPRPKLRNGRHIGNEIAKNSFLRRTLLTNKLQLQTAFSSQSIPLPPSTLEIFRKIIIFNKTRPNTHRTTRAHNVFVPHHTYSHKYGSERRSKRHHYLPELLESWFEITVKYPRTTMKTAVILDELWL